MADYDKSKYLDDTAILEENVDYCERDPEELYADELDNDMLYGSENIVLDIGSIVTEIYALAEGNELVKPSIPGDPCVTYTIFCKACSELRGHGNLIEGLYYTNDNSLEYVVDALTETLLNRLPAVNDCSPMDADKWGLSIDALYECIDQAVMKLL